MNTLNAVAVEGVGEYLQPALVELAAGGK